MVEELKLERAEEAVRRQNLEDEVVDNDGKAAVSAMLDLLTTDEGKSMIKEEKKMVKVGAASCSLRCRRCRVALTACCRRSGWPRTPSAAS
jgi:hypothetical protein